MYGLEVRISAFLFLWPFLSVGGRTGRVKPFAGEKGSPQTFDMWAALDCEVCPAWGSDVWPAWGSDVWAALDSDMCPARGSGWIGTALGLAGSELGSGEEKCQIRKPMTFVHDWLEGTLLKEMVGIHSQQRCPLNKVKCHTV